MRFLPDSRQPYELRQDVVPGWTKGCCQLLCISTLRASIKRDLCNPKGTAAQPYLDQSSEARSSRRLCVERGTENMRGHESGRARLLL